MRKGFINEAKRDKLDLGEGSDLSKRRLDVNIGCGRSVLSFFLGLACLVVATAIALSILLW